METEENACPTETTEFVSIDSSEGHGERSIESLSQRRLRYAAMLGIIIGTTLGPQNDGMAATWPNVFASDLETDTSTLFNTSLHMSDSEMDFTSSSYYIASLPVIAFSGWLVSWLGRKRCMILCSLPGTISWLLVGLAPNVSMLFTGRSLCGASHGLQGIAVRSYLSEVSDAKFRGAAGVTTESMKGIAGILVIFLGILMPWYYVAIFCGCQFFFFGFLVVPCLPESPSHLIVKGEEEKAIGILKKLRGPYVDAKDMVKRLKKENERSDGSTGWRVLLKPDILKRYFIVAGLFFLSNFSGVEVMRANATRMLQDSGLAFDKDVTTMIVFVVLLSGNISQTLVLDYIGRRKCLVLSLLLLVVAYVILGAYHFVHVPDTGTMVSTVIERNATVPDDFRYETRDMWSWVPTACLMTVAFGCSLGIGPIPWLLSTEYFPTTIRPQVLAVCSITANIATFAALQLYSPLKNLLTPAGLYCCYAIFSAMGILYTTVFVYETKGISIG